MSLLVRVLATLFLLTLSCQFARAAGENISGVWSPVAPLPLVPSSGAVLPNGKVLLWAADGEFSFSSGGSVYTTLFDPATYTSTPKQFQGGHNMFCTGTTNMADGRIFVNGGTQATGTTIYDPGANIATRAHDMNVMRGYNSNTILPDGSILTVGGSWSGGVSDKKGEVWTAATGWRFLSGASTAPMAPASIPDYPRDSHMWLMPAGNGRVFYAGPSESMQWIDTEGDGSIKPAGLRGDDTFSSQGMAVMYDKGLILKLGGTRKGGVEPAFSATYKIDIRNGVAVSKLIPMSYPRAYANAVVLPDGKVMIVGGQTFAQDFSDVAAVMQTEVWDPATSSFTLTAPIDVPRNYHSIALLLPDGRVLSAGGGLCGTCSANHPDLQIYSPGYLFDADGAPKPRPTITSAPDQADYGRSVTVTTDREVSSFSFVRVGSTTHTIDNDQRRLPLSFTRTGENTYQVEIPSNPGWLLPGYWMLFAFDASGTPSVSKMVRVNVSTIATLSADNVARIAIDAPASIQPRIVKINPNATLAVSGLPAGLSFDNQTGAITGAVSAAGSYPVRISATDGTSTVATEFVIVVDQPGGVGTGSGLLADYFTNTNVSGSPVASRVEAPWFADDTVGAGTGVSPASFSARWSGVIIPQRGGVTEIQARNDDGVRIWINGKLVIDNWTSHATNLDVGDVELIAGARNPIYIEYFNASGGSTLQLSWRRSGDAVFSPIPVSQLYPGRPLSMTNLALGKTTTQSSTPSTWAGSYRAVDGDLAGATYALTSNEYGASWQVDLGAPVDIGRIRVWNRTSCCLERMQNFLVFFSDQNLDGRSPASILADPDIKRRTVSAASPPSDITIQGGVRARFVRVQLADTNPLQLAEVEIYPESANNPPVISGLPANMPLIFGSAASLQVAASDPEGQAFAFDASNLPAGLSITADGLISGTPTSLGTGVATITVRDVSGLFASVQLPWTVMSGLPSVSRLIAPPAATGATVVYSPVIANGVGATYSWNFGDGSPSTNFSASPGASHVFAAPGIMRVTLILKAFDGRQTTYAFNQAVYAPVASGARPVSSSGSAFETRAGVSRLWIANPDNDSVGVIDLASFTLAAEIAVGKRPVNVALHPNGDVWVINRDSATISVIDAATLALKQTVMLPRASRPYGLVFAGRTGFVTLEASESVAQVTEAGAYAGAAPVGSSPRHIALAASGDKFLVSRFITPPLPGEGTAVVATIDAFGHPVGGEVIELGLAGAVSRTFILKHSEATDTSISARGIPNYLGAAAIAPDGKTAWVPSKQDNIKRGVLRDGNNLDFQSSVRAILSKIDLQTGLEILSDRVDLDNSGVASAAVFHPSGAYIFVALQTSREVAVVDPVNARELFRFTVGRAPSALTLSPDGGALYVTNFMDRAVMRVSLSPLLSRGLNSVSGRVSVRTIVTEKLGANVLRGKRLFYDAADRRLARDGYLSCASCHDNGEHDGRVWDFTGFGEGLRNTISLDGHGGMRHGFLHWTANFDEVQDFEGQIRNFAQGTGLMTNERFAIGTRSQPLGDRKTGASADLDALAAYVASRTVFPESPWRNPDGSLTTAAQSGKAAFTAAGCATCHAGAKMTISGDATRLRNVGTIKPSSGSRLGGALTGIDVPSLLGAFATAPYLHDGSARTLDDAIQAHATVAVGAADRANIAQYLKEIGGTP